MKVAALTFLAVLSLMLLQSAAAATEQEPFPDPETLQYLDRLYKNVKKLRRPLVMGELNLLPEHSEGFANSVRCFTEISATAVMDNSRTLRFNLSNDITPADKIVAIDLVLKQAPGASSYKTHLHEISGDGMDMDLKLLDSGDYSGEWHALHVQNFVDSVDGTSGRRDYRLLLSISGGEGAGDVLHRVKPMLLIYSNDQDQGVEGEYADWEAPSASRNMAAHSRSRSKESRQEDGRSRSGHSHRRRRREVTSASSESNSRSLSLSDMQSLSCQRQVRVVSFHDLGWPGSALYDVLSPSRARFSFCAGTCADPYNQGTTNYTNHAKMVSLTQPRLEGVTPCCVPTQYKAVRTTYASKFSGVTTMTTYPNAISCGCR